MTHDEALRYLASIEGLGIKLALENITEVLRALGDPQSACPSVLISGTNGKGSVAAMTAAILSRTGRRTGLYTSAPPPPLRGEDPGRPGRPGPPGGVRRAVGEVRERIDRSSAPDPRRSPTHFETMLHSVNYW